jgi:hypothetical protein
MKLFYLCPTCYKKVYLASGARSRPELASQWGQSFIITCVHCTRPCQVYPNAVKAEKANLPTILATTLGGGGIGILAGPLGIAIGLAVGGITAWQLNSNTEKGIERFNSS